MQTTRAAVATAEEVRPRMKKWMYVPIIGFLLLFAACSGGPTATKRFRVIATVEVDGQKVEGSTVMDITYEKLDEKRSALGRGGAATAKGEALILDLKGRGTADRDIQIRRFELARDQPRHWHAKQRGFRSCSPGARAHSIPGAWKSAPVTCVRRVSR